MEAIEVWADCVVRDGRQVAATLRYQAPDTVWTHSFVATVLEDDDVGRLLAQEGFGPPEWRGAEDSWVCSRTA